MSKTATASKNSSYEAIARSKAGDRGIELTVEPQDGGSKLISVEIWSYNAHVGNDPLIPCHTVFVHQDEELTTVPRVWKRVAEELDEFVHPCPDDCECWTARTPKPQS